jgi:hypothetical protein
MGKIELRNFDGDYDALSALAHASWLAEYGENSFPDLYQPALARHFFADAPDPRFLIAALDGPRLVGFVANLPRTYALNGQTYKGVYSCMLVCHPDYRGAAVYLIAESLHRNEAYGADLALMTLEKPHRSWRMFDQFLKPNHRIVTLKIMHPIVRAVDFAKIVVSENLKGYEAAAIRLLGAHRPITAPAVPGMMRPYQESDLDEILALTRRIACPEGRRAGPNCLVRMFDKESLARHLHTVGVAATVVYERGSAVAGFVNFTIRDMVSPRGREPWGWLDFLYWGGPAPKPTRELALPKEVNEGLDRQEKQALLAGVWETSRELGCIGLLEWNKAYYASWPLYRAHFIPYPRALEVDAWIFNPGLSLAGPGGLFEQVI